MSENFQWSSNSWSPDIMGKRISNIILCYSSFADTADASFQEKLMMHFAKQVRCLEIDQRHLVKDKKRMSCLLGIIAGRVCLTPIKSEVETILAIVISEAGKLLNNTGMHLSRQPQLHIELLKILIEIRSLASATISNARIDLEDLVSKMTANAKFFRHGNGSIGKFNGGCSISKHWTEQILKKADVQVKISSKLTEDGYARINSKLSTVIFDCGTPKTNWDNWSAGTLSFEFSHGKQMIVVNSGSNKIDSRWSIPLRSTSAHSSLIIDKRNSSSILNINEDSQIAHISERVVEKSNQGLLAHSTHDGFFSTYGIFHKRKLLLSNDGSSLEGEDELIYSGAPGKIPLEAEIRFHLGPNISASKVFGGDILLRMTNGLGWNFNHKNGKSYIEDSIYIKNSTPLKIKQIIIRNPLSELRSKGSITVRWCFTKPSKKKN